MVERIAPILRGLLARPTGDVNHPYQPVILKGNVDANASARGTGSGSRLVLNPIRGAETDDELRASLSAALAAHRAAQQSDPEVISLPDGALLQVTRSSPKPGDQPHLVGRVAVVTGAAGAIGHGICQALLESGCHLAITDLPGERLNHFVAEFTGRDASRVLAVPMDVTDPASVEEAFTQIITRWGGIDIVVLNAGAALARPLVEINLEDFRRLERVNVEGTFLVLAESGRLFARQNTGGDIVLISTKNVFAPGAGFGAYSATKAAAHQLARIASLEFAPMGVRVNMVAPDAVFSSGAHKSGLWAEVGPGRMKARGLDAAGLEEYYRNRNLLKAKVTAEHVANAVLFFLLHKTPTTGACIPVDGGLPDATPR